MVQKASRLKENTIYSMIYQIIVFITPLITSPYLSRVLGAESMGVFTYTQTIVNYFFLFGMLGINNYGSRAIAKTANNKKELGHTFWQIYYLQIIQALFTITVFLGSLRFISTAENRWIILIQALQLVSIFTDVNWFAFGLERFKWTTIRNIVVKVLTIICIFLFIKSPADVWVYSLIVGAGTIAGLLVVWPLIISETSFELPQWKTIFSHLKPNFILFLPQLGMSLQAIDKIMLGAYSTLAVGYYGYAEHIINVPFGLITAVTTVGMPRISNLLANGQKEEANQLIRKGFHYTTILEIALGFGVFAVAELFVPLYLGENYLETAYLLKWLAFTIPLHGMVNVLRLMYLVPNGKDGLYLWSVVIGAVGNIIGNFFLIPIMGAYGACVSTILCYLISLLFLVIVTNREIKYGAIILKLLPYILYGGAMWLTIYFIDLLTINAWVLLLLEVCAGGLLYVVLACAHLAFIEKDALLGKMTSKFLRRNK